MAKGGQPLWSPVRDVVMGRAPRMNHFQAWGAISVWQRCKMVVGGQNPQKIGDNKKNGNPFFFFFFFFFFSGENNSMSMSFGKKLVTL